ncbi:MAG: PspC domain-containing protein [Nocardioides sp.]|nr:PspC domain-containing protein [Nocardioides sp.]
MTSPGPTAYTPLPPEHRGVRRATRDTESPMLGGVAGGLARHLGVSVTLVRAAFVMTAALSGLGLAMYAGLWLMLPGQDRFETGTPGAESATRGGRRPGRVRRLSDAGPAVALAALAFGAVLVVEAVLGEGAVFWPLAIGLVGVALLWRQADVAQRERWLDTTGRLDPLRVVFGDGGWASYGRVAAGVVLVGSAFLLLSLRSGSLGLARDLTLAGLIGMAGIFVVVGPWVFRLISDLTAERAERVRTQERADVAAHLHDSVLQTLALIQKNAGDFSTVTRLARSQERDLRSWLYAAEATGDATVASALRTAAAHVEDDHGVSVDLDTVGDAPLVDELRPVVAATGEAMTNAARHAGTASIDVYVEVSGTCVEVFVRDRGRGFDPEDLPEDRYGVRHSIRDRMTRHGGTAEIRSAPGEGTEVRLSLPVPQEEQR